MLEELVRSSEPVTAPTTLAPGRAKTGRPHPQELRSHVITAVLAGASYREAAAQYGVSVTAAFTWAKRFRQTGRMVAKPMGGDRRSRLKSERDWLLRRVSAAPSLTLAQLHEELRARGIGSVASRCRNSSRRRISKSKKGAPLAEECAVQPAVGTHKPPYFWEKSRAASALDKLSRAILSKSYGVARTSRLLKFCFSRLYPAFETGSVVLYRSPIDQNRCAHWRNPMDMMRQG